MHLLLHKLPPDAKDEYPKYYLDAVDSGRYMHIIFHKNSLSIETNCSEERMSGMLGALTNFTMGNLRNIDDLVAALESTG